MAEIQKGIAVVWGISTAAFTFTGTASALTAATSQLTGQTVRRSARKVEVSNKVGETIGLVYVNPIDELDLEIFPSDTTLSLAKTANVLPSPGDKLAIAVTTGDVDTNITGNWIVEECSKMKKSDNYVSFTVKLIKYATDLSATIS